MRNSIRHPTMEIISLKRRFTSTETIRLIRDGRMEVGEEGERDKDLDKNKSVILSCSWYFARVINDTRAV